MGDHGQRETISRADATRWYDHVAAGVLSEEGLAAAHAYHVSPALVLEAARLIAGYIAAGETEMSRADTIGQAKSRERKAHQRAPGAACGEVSRGARLHQARRRSRHDAGPRPSGPVICSGDVVPCLRKASRRAAEFAHALFWHRCCSAPGIIANASAPL